MQFCRLSFVPYTIKAKGTLMQMVAADWLRSDKREDDLAGRYGGIIQKYVACGGPEFFVINIQIVHKMSHALNIDASMTRLEERTCHMQINDEKLVVPVMLVLVPNYFRCTLMIPLFITRYLRQGEVECTKQSTC
ncbi:hypothetical protein ACS0TY_013533 [Phlomoides rotata]